MKYYNIEALKNEPELYGAVSSLKDFNKEKLFDDRLFLSSIFGMYKMQNRMEEFSSVLKYFYEDYKGDKKGWLRHTLSIVYIFADLLTNVYLSSQLSKVADGEKVTQKDVLKKLRLQILKSSESTDSQLKKIAHQYGWSHKALHTAWYNLDK